MNPTPGSTASYYALLIGIDCYLPNLLPNGGTYPNLGGCVRDVKHVRDYLKQQLQVPDDHVLSLMATVGPGGRPAEAEDQWPTYQHMVDKFKALADMAAPGSEVIVHYSGHGGRTCTAWPNLKGPDGLDEALVPTDLGNSEARYLRDVELAYLLKAIVDKGANLTVILDSCHSGGATRGVTTAVARKMTVPPGVPDVDTTTPPKDSAVASMAELENSWRGQGGATRAAKPASGWLVEPQGYTLLAACRANESAYEDFYAPGRTERNGALTYWLLDSLRTLPAGISYAVLQERLLAKIRSKEPAQTPQLQGIGDRPIFGSGQVRTVYAIPVMTVNQAAGQVTLNAGEAQGLRPGSLLAVYPLGTNDLESLAGRQALLEVTAVNSESDSTARITQTFDGPIEQGAQAVIVGSTDANLQRTVGLALPTGSPYLAPLQTAIETLGQGFVRLAVPPERLDFQVALNDKGEYEIWDGAGMALPNLRPPIAAAGDGAADSIARRLVHLAKYRLVQDLNNPDPAMARMVGVEMTGAPVDVSGRAPILKPGDHFTLKITNLLTPNPADIDDPTRILNVTVLDLSPDWSVTQIYPSTADSEIVQPGKSIELPFDALLPPGYDDATDIVKVFATQTTTAFRSLGLPALDQPRATRSGTRSVSKDPLEQLMDAFTDEQAPSQQEVRTRQLALTSTPIKARPWATAQVEMRVVKPA